MGQMNLKLNYFLYCYIINLYNIYQAFTHMFSKIDFEKYMAI